MFKQLHPECLNQLRALLNQTTEPVYFHADGNMYIDKGASDTRQKFTNYNADGPNHPANVGARYRVKFTSPGQVPTDLDSMEKMFLEQRQKEDTAAITTAERKGNFVFSVPKEPIVAKTIPLPEDNTGADMAKTTKKSAAADKAAALAAALAAVTGEPGTDGAPKV